MEQLPSIQAGTADPIKHVVLLMLENHSFDQMLGCFKEIYPELEGVDPKNSHVNTDPAGNQYKQIPTRERQMLLDPHHEVDHVRTQLEDGNSGFVRDFSVAFPESTSEKRQYIMGYYPLDFLPAVHRLARDFTICDHWFSSVPGPTWPNRFFALTGTCCGVVDMPEDGQHGADIKGWFEQDQPTIFDRLSEKGIQWKSYYHDIPQTAVLVRQRLPENAAHYHHVNGFYDDARGLESDFPAFCLIEPDFNGVDENDDHPPHDIMKAQKLIADVYNALRVNRDLWNSTLLVVFYDEHGGFYDHIPPPAAIPPDNHKDYPFNRLGIRVPALLISPWVARGFNSTQFDHTSLLKYLIDKWGLGALGDRAASANSISFLIGTSGQPRTDTVDWIQLSENELQPPDPDLEEQATGFVSQHHASLITIKDYLVVKVDEATFPVVVWFERLIERVFGSKSDPAPFPTDDPTGIAQRYKGTKDSTQTFLTNRKEQALTRLSEIILDAKLPFEQRLDATRTLGQLIGRRLHTENKKGQTVVDSAVKFLRTHPKLVLK